MKGGENDMQYSNPNDQLWLINQLRQQAFERAAISRRFETPAPSIRRAIGTRIIRFGARLAGEPTYTLARPQ
jgi:hypothetical protein